MILTPAALKPVRPKSDRHLTSGRPRVAVHEVSWYRPAVARFFFFFLVCLFSSVVSVRLPSAPSDGFTAPRRVETQSCDTAPGQS